MYQHWQDIQIIIIIGWSLQTFLFICESQYSPESNSLIQDTFRKKSLIEIYIKHALQIMTTDSAILHLIALWNVDILGLFNRKTSIIHFDQHDKPLVM